MAVLKVILSVVFVLICIALTVIVLLQEGKSAGLGSISGMAESAFLLPNRLRPAPQSTTTPAKWISRRWSG